MILPFKVTNITNYTKSAPSALLSWHISCIWICVFWKWDYRDLCPTIQQWSIAAVFELALGVRSISGCSLWVFVRVPKPPFRRCGSSPIIEPKANILDFSLPKRAVVKSVNNPSVPKYPIGLTAAGKSLIPERWWSKAPVKRTTYFFTIYKRFFRHETLRYFCGTQNCCSKTSSKVMRIEAHRNF